MGNISVVIVMVIVVNWSTIIVLFGVGKRFLGVMSEVRYMFLIFIVRVLSLVGHWVIVFTVKTTMVVRAIIEVL